MGARGLAASAGVFAAAALALAGCGSSSPHKTQTTAQNPTTGTITAAKHAPAKHAQKHAHTRTPRRTASTTPNTTRTNTAPSPSPANGLRANGGYGLYELCSGHCTGSVPAALERTLRLPGLGPGGACPVSTGPGPVSTIGSANIRLQGFIGSAWRGGRVTWRSSARYRGPVLIRGRQVGGSGVVGFGEGHVPYDQLQLLDAAQGMPRGPAREWPSFTRVRSPGCYAYQVDGTSFSYVIVFRAR